MYWLVFIARFCGTLHPAYPETFQQTMA